MTHLRVRAVAQPKEMAQLMHSLLKGPERQKGSVLWQAVELQPEPLSAI